MKNKKKWLLAVLVLTVCLCAWFYWKTEMPLSRILPEESWSGAILFEGFAGVGEVELEDARTEWLLAAIAETSVTRGWAFHGISQSYFEVILHREGGPSTLIYVLEDGRVSVAIDRDVDNYLYFRDGDELYRALAEMVSGQT